MTVPRVHVSTRIPIWLLQAIKDRAKAEHRTVSNMLVCAIERGIASPSTEAAAPPAGPPAAPPQVRQDEFFGGGASTPTGKPATTVRNEKTQVV